MDKKQDPTLYYLQETCFKHKHTLKGERWKKMYHTNANHKKVGMAIFLSDKGYYKTKKNKNRASLVAQWLRICLPMRVRALVWEDPTYRGATRPVSHSY